MTFDKQVSSISRASITISTRLVIVCIENFSILVSLRRKTVTLWPSLVSDGSKKYCLHEIMKIVNYIISHNLWNVFEQVHTLSRSILGFPVIRGHGLRRTREGGCGRWSTFPIFSCTSQRCFYNRKGTFPILRRLLIENPIFLSMSHNCCSFVKGIHLG